MTKLQQTVNDFLDSNRSMAEEIMQEGGWVKEWTNWEDFASLPFEFKGVDSYGGEGCGDDFWTVIETRLPDDPTTTQLVKLRGWYASYVGAEYNGWNFVQPKQKTITVYE